MSAPCPPHLQGSYEGLRAWGICQLVRLGAVEPKKGKKAAKVGGRCCWSCGCVPGRARVQAPAGLGAAPHSAVYSACPAG